MEKTVKFMEGTWRGHFYNNHKLIFELKLDGSMLVSFSDLSNEPKYKGEYVIIENTFLAHFNDVGGSIIGVDGYLSKGGVIMDGKWYEKKYNDFVIRKEYDSEILPEKFKLLTYGVSGSKDEQSNFWIGLNNKSIYLIDVNNNPNYPILEFNKVIFKDGDERTLAIKVLNYMTDGDYFLNVSDDKNIEIVRFEYEHIPDSAKFSIRKPWKDELVDELFISLESVKFPDYFIRHESFNLKISKVTSEDKENNNLVLLGDASWRFDEV